MQDSDKKWLDYRATWHALKFRESQMDRVYKSSILMILLYGFFSIPVTFFLSYAGYKALPQSLAGLLFLLLVGIHAAVLAGDLVRAKNAKALLDEYRKLLNDQSGQSWSVIDIENFRKQLSIIDLQAFGRL